jgi:short-subunit dehydrogenase
VNLEVAVKAIESADDRIDLLVNNAGYVVHMSVLDVTEDEISKYVQCDIISFTVQRHTSAP